MRGRLSLRLRLLIAVGVTTLAALALADVVVYGSLQTYLYNQVDNTLATSHTALERAVIAPGRALGDGAAPLPSGAPPIGGVGQPARGDSTAGSAGTSVFCTIGLRSAPAIFIEVRTAQNRIASGVAGREECPSLQPGSVSYSPKLPVTITGYSTTPGAPTEVSVTFSAMSTVPTGPMFRVRATKLDSGGVLIVAAPISNITSTLSQLRIVELLVTIAALVAGTLLGLWLVRVGLRPLRDVERTAEAIADGDLMQRVPYANVRTEVGRMAAAFNVMLERIEVLVADLRSSEGRLRRFVGDASHELRTPIAAVSAYAQLGRAGITTEPEDLQRVMAGIERESGRMAKLVEDLLTLAKLDDHRDAVRERVELVGLTIEAIETARLVGPRWPIVLIAADVVEVSGDRSALRQVIDNLLANVRAHTPEGTTATVSVATRERDAVIEVIDDGPGITDANAALLFERFFRVDPSRSRETGGAGLGLAIVASIVETHGGSVTAGPGERGGAAFRVVLPALGPISDGV